MLAANDPTKLAPGLAATLRKDQHPLLPLHRPGHSHWFKPKQTLAFARELRNLGVPVSYHVYANARGEWRAQFDTGLAWALRPADAIRAQRARFPATRLLRGRPAPAYIADPAGRGARVGRSPTKRS